VLVRDCKGFFRLAVARSRGGSIIITRWRVEERIQGLSSSNNCLGLPMDLMTRGSCSVLGVGVLLKRAGAGRGRERWC